MTCYFDTPASMYSVADKYNINNVSLLFKNRTKHMSTVVRNNEKWYQNLKNISNRRGIITIQIQFASTRHRIGLL